MSATRPALDVQGPNPITSDLETLLTRELGARDASPRDPGQSYSRLRLQPVVLQPPPGEDASQDFWSAHGSSPEDDIDLGLDDDQSLRRRQLLFAAIGIGIAVVGAAAYLIFGPDSEPSTARGPVPTIQADPATLTKGPPPDTQLYSSASSGRSVSDQGMGAVSTELVPPSTDGLSPARRIATTRIIVENDREVTAPR
jgi:hypothetical protein